jgi:hypothetical protein
MAKIAAERYPRSRLLTASSIIGGLMAFVFLLEKIYLPQNQNGLSIPPLVDAIIFLVIGLSVSVAMAQYSYRAWSLDPQSFMEWYFCQQIGPTGWLRKWYDRFPEGHLRSQYRLMGPIGFLAGIGMAILGLMIIVAPIFAA